MTIVTPSSICMHRASGCKYRPAGNAHSVFSLKPTSAVPCGPPVTSLYPTMTSTTLTNNFLLLFTDVAITPTLLEALNEFDVLHIALGCRFALDIFTISQQLFTYTCSRATSSRSWVRHTSEHGCSHMHHVGHVSQLAWTTFITVFYP